MRPLLRHFFVCLFVKLELHVIFTLLYYSRNNWQLFKTMYTEFVGHKENIVSHGTGIKHMIKTMGRDQADKYYSMTQLSHISSFSFLFTKKNFLIDLYKQKIAQIMSKNSLINIA